LNPIPHLEDIQAHPERCTSSGDMMHMYTKMSIPLTRPA
jgi:hypothetical protein